MIAIVVAAFLVFLVISEARSQEAKPEEQNPVTMMDWTLSKSASGCVMTFRPEKQAEGYVVSFLFVDGNTIVGFTAPGVKYPETEKIKTSRLQFMDGVQHVPDETVNLTNDTMHHLQLTFAGNIVADFAGRTGVLIYLEAESEMPNNGVYRYQWYATPLWAMFSACAAAHK